MVARMVAYNWRLASYLAPPSQTDILAPPPPGEPPEVGGGAGSVSGIHPSSSAQGLHCFALFECPLWFRSETEFWGEIIE
jgi:hypothetical protein